MVVRRASILLLTLVVDVFSLLPRGNTLPRHAARSGRQTAQMLVGAPAASDAFGKVADDCGAAADLFAKTGPTVGELASKSATVAGAALAGVLMPGSLVVSGVGALVGGSVTRLAVAPTLVEGRYKAMQAKIAGLLRDAAVAGDWTTVTSAEVDAVVREYGLPGDYSVALLCQIYTKYLLEVMRMPDVKTAEMNDLVALREILGLDAEAAGNAHYDVAVEVYGQLQWTGDEVLKDPESAEHKTVSKLLFLSDRAFAGTAADSVSDEAYGYEVGRVRAVFGLEQADLEDRCSAIAAPFYDRALAGTLEKLDSVNPDMLARARAKLGITDQTASDMHLDCYTAEVGELLAANGNSLSDADDARLESLATILAVPKDAAAEATATLTVPLYVAATRDAVEAGIGADDAAAAALGPSLDKMKVDLRLTDSAAEGVFRSAVREVLAAPYKAATDALKLQNTPGALASVSRLMDVQKGVETVVKTAPFLSGADAGSFFDDLLGVTGKSLPLSLYKLVYVEKLGDALDDGAKAELGALAKTLSLTPSDTALVHEQILAPKLDIKLGEMLREATPDRTDLDAWVAQVDFPAALLKEKMDRAYTDRIRAYSSENSILSVERKAQLDSLQAFLELSDEDVYAAKKATFLPTYAKSALEAMGASGGGIVADEYKEGLAKLQARLDLRDEDAQTAFAAAAKDRLQPLVEGVVGAFEEIVLTPEQLAKKRGIDAGDDLNVDKGAGGTFGIDEGAAVGAGSPEKVLSELAAVVDFVLGNGLATEPEELGGAWTYAVDCAALVPPDLRADLFKQCVLSSLQVSEGDAITDAKKERYANAVFHLPGVLGVDDVDAAKAKQEVGNTIAQKYCGAALAQKATLDGADAAFVANLEEKLGVDLGDVSFAAKKNALLDKLNKVSQGYNDPNTAAKAAELRDAAVAMGIDLKKDLGLPANKVQALFAAEAVAAIEGDDDDAAAAVGDVADGYGLGADEASSYLVALADKVCLECIDNAKADLITKKPVNACESLDKLLLYHQFANLDDGALGAAAASKKDEMVSLYANYCNARGPEIEAKAVALKELMA